MDEMIAVKCDNMVVYCEKIDDYSVGELLIISFNENLVFGEVSKSNLKFNQSDYPNHIGHVVRIATDEDCEKYKSNLGDAKRALRSAKRIKNELKLNMKIIDCFCSFDRSQLLFNFVASGRVDFRELAKKLAQIYKTRIELRQIGVRDNAKKIGGIGPCGRFLCCTTYLTDFNSVSISMAKNQYIALNPNKINGVCGRLLCCLKYEDDQYTEMKKEFPKIGQVLTVKGVSGRVSSVNMFLNTAVIEKKNRVFVEVSLGDNSGSN